VAPSRVTELVWLFAVIALATVAVEASAQIPGEACGCEDKPLPEDTDVSSEAPVPSTPPAPPAPRPSPPSRPQIK